MVKMIQIYDPNDTQAADIRELVAACRRHDRTSLSFPLEEGMILFLAYEDNRLCAALSLLPSEDDLWECRGFTHPDFRRQGLFSGLLDQGLEAAGDAVSLCFPVDPRCEAAMAAVESLEAEFWYAEYMMERPLTEADAAAVLPDVSLSFKKDPDTDSWTCSAAVDGRIIGTAALLSHGSLAYLCQVLVPEDIRGQGYGTLLILHILKALAANQVPAVCLQVSGDNEAAMALYKKTGFQMTETLSYYLF